MVRKRILIVDDDLELDRSIKVTLEETGRYEVKWETKGSKAFGTARQYQPDLILLDVLMPDTGGGDVARQLKENESTRRIPIAYMTGIVTKEETESHGGCIGGYPFLSKPVSLQEIICCIEKYSKTK